MSNRLDDINKETSTPVSTDAPLDHHPDSLAPLGKILVDEQSGPGEVCYRAARLAMVALHDGALAMQQAYDAIALPVDVSMKGTGAFRRQVPENKKAELANAMASKFASIAKTAERNEASVQDSIASLESRIATALGNPRRNDNSVATAASEIRTHIKSLPSKDRMGFLNDAIEQGDREVLDAVIGYSCFASGLDRKQLVVVRQLAAAKFAPRETRQLEAARTVFDRCRAAQQSFVGRYLKLLPKVGEESRATVALRKLKSEAA